jgi:hypothetical protein
VPTIYQSRDFAVAGGLLSYGMDLGRHTDNDGFVTRRLCRRATALNFLLLCLALRAAVTSGELQYKVAFKKKGP